VTSWGKWANLGPYKGDDFWVHKENQAVGETTKQNLLWERLSGFFLLFVVGLGYLLALNVHRWPLSHPWAAIALLAGSGLHLIPPVRKAVKKNLWGSWVISFCFVLAASMWMVANMLTIYSRTSGHLRTMGKVFLNLSDICLGLKWIPYKESLRKLSHVCGYFAAIRNCGNCCFLDVDGCIACGVGLLPNLGNKLLFLWFKIQC
jgi:hypothetical protein